MIENGFVLIYRKLLDSQAFTHPDPFITKLLIWCLLKANWKESAWMSGVQVQRGQFITGEKSAAIELEVSNSKWRRGMKLLETMGTIERKATNKYTVVTLKNWGKYQYFDAPNAGPRRTGDGQATDGRRTDDGRVTTIEQGNNRTREQVERERGRDDFGFEIPVSLRTPDFESAWELYQSWHLTETGKRLSPCKAQVQLKRFLDHGPEKATADLLLTIECSTNPGGRIWDSSRQTPGSNSKPEDGPNKVQQLKSLLDGVGNG